MGLSKEDRILIENLYECKGYGAKRLMKEFPTKEWKKTTLNDFLKHLRQNRTTDVVGSLEYCSAVASTVGATGKPQLVLCS